MAKRARGRRAVIAQPVTSRTGDVATGVIHVVGRAVTTALAGARDVGTEVSYVAVSAVRGSIRAASEIGADVGRLAVNAAEGAIDAADRITTAAGRAATNLVDATIGGAAGTRRLPEPRVDGDAPSARPRGSRAVPMRSSVRKPLARRPSRGARQMTGSRRRGAA